jgi:hypothetical protein
LARRGSKSWERLTINYAINVVKIVMPSFYIFRGERLRDDYIKFYKLGACMAMQKRTWMTAFLFKKFLSIFKRSILGGVSFTNRHLLILDGHDSHVTLKAIKHAKDIGLDMITLPFHTSHALQPLYVFCFKPFKITFKKVKDVTMFKNNH